MLDNSECLAAYASSRFFSLVSWVQYETAKSEEFAQFPHNTAQTGFINRKNGIIKEKESTADSKMEQRTYGIDS